MRNTTPLTSSQLLPTQPPERKTAESKSAQEHNNPIYKRLPNQSSTATITVSTINATRNNYQIARTKTLTKAIRAKNLLEKNPTTYYVLIDDTQYNVSSCSNIDDKITCHLYNKDTDLRLLNIPQETVLLLDFDLTITTEHTFPKNRTELYNPDSTDTVTFNRNILELLTELKGSLIIFTDHNNNQYVTDKINQLINQCNLEHNSSQTHHTSDAKCR